MGRLEDFIEFDMCRYVVHGIFLVGCTDLYQLELAGGE